MTPAFFCFVLLTTAVALGAGRVVLTFWRTHSSNGKKVWRIFMLVLLQISSAILLYLTLFPPTTLTHAGRLTLLTANANHVNFKSADRIVALPEAPTYSDAPVVPDFATALRRYPDVHHFQIVGAGLLPRDQDAAHDVEIAFSPSPLPPGFIELSQPDRVSPGTRWQVAGRVAHLNNARVDLFDPGNALVASTKVDSDGFFALADVARTPGLARYQLRIFNDKQNLVDALDVPLNIEQDASLKVLMLSGGPNPELKYFRRWALDAGVQLQSQIGLSPGVELASAPMSIASAQLRDLDLLILDDRAWNTMPRSSKQSVIDALHAGMGVLLRLTGPLSANDRNELRVLGFNVEDANIVQGIRLENVNDKHTPINLTRRPLLVTGSDTVTLLRDDEKNPLALWRAVGQGRMGLLWLTDSYRLVLNGDTSGHGQIWRDAVSILSRARAESLPFLRSRNVWVNESVVICNIASKTYVQAPSGDMTYLSVNDNGVNNNCSAFWPRVTGWHTVVSDMKESVFYVRATNEAHGLKLNALREATMLLASQHSTEKNSARIPVPGSPWPWFFAWLLITGILWWLEKSRWGLNANAH